MYKKHSRIISVILALMLVLSMCCLSVNAAGTTTIKTPSGTIEANVGDQVTVNFWWYIPETLDGNGNVMETNGYEAYMEFDNTTIKPSQDVWTAMGVNEGEVEVNPKAEGYAPYKLFPLNYEYFNKKIYETGTPIYSIIYNCDTKTGNGNSAVKLVASSGQSGFANLSVEGGVQLMSITFDVIAAGETTVACIISEGQFFDTANPGPEHQFWDYESGDQAVSTSDVLLNGAEVISHTNGNGVYNFSQKPFGPEEPTATETETETETETATETEKIGRAHV